MVAGGSNQEVKKKTKKKEKGSCYAVCAIKQNHLLYLATVFSLLWWGL